MSSTEHLAPSQRTPKLQKTGGNEKNTKLAMNSKKSSILNKFLNNVKPAVKNNGYGLSTGSNSASSMILLLNFGDTIGFDLLKSYGPTPEFSSTLTRNDLQMYKKLLIFVAVGHLIVS